MLDATFIHLIAAGLEVILRPPGNDLSSNQILEAGASTATSTNHLVVDQLIPGLLTTAPAPTSQVINRCVADIWQSCQQIGITADLAEAHLAALPQLLLNSELSSIERRSLLSPSSDAIASDANLLAERLVSARRMANASTDNLDETVLGFLLEHLFLSFAASHDAIAEIQQTLATTQPWATTPIPPGPPIANDTGSSPEPKPDPESAAAAPIAIQKTAPAAATASLTLAKIERADALGIAVPLLDVITVNLINLAKSPSIRQSDLLAAASSARSLASRLHHLSQQPLPGLEKTGSALIQFNAGRLADCDRILATVEDVVVKSSIGTALNDSKPTKAALEIRIIRADLQVLAGAFLKAARHYGFAQRYIPRQDYEDRWPITLQEARHYERAAFYAGQADGLDKAARTCTSVLAAVPATDTTAVRANAQTELARLLIILGQKEHRPERFELAAQLLADAESIYRTASDPRGLATATAHRAEALALFGDHLQAADILTAAAQHYQSALEQAASIAIEATNPPDQAASAGHLLGLRTGMALSIAALATQNGATQTENEAMAMVSDALPHLISIQLPSPTAGFAHHAMIARCHTALANWHSSRAEPHDATDHAKRAIAAYLAAAMPDMAAMLRQRFNHDKPSPTRQSTTTKATAA